MDYRDTRSYLLDLCRRKRGHLIAAKRYHAPDELTPRLALHSAQRALATLRQDHQQGVI